MKTNSRQTTQTNRQKAEKSKHLYRTYRQIYKSLHFEQNQIRANFNSSNNFFFISFKSLISYDNGNMDIELLLQYNFEEFNQIHSKLSLY